MKEKIALVNQRYGLEVNGGSELYCRQLAEKLKSVYDVEILTSCAMDYITWKNYFKEGTEDLNGITVRRFKTERERDIASFNRFTEVLYADKHHSDEDETRWIEEQGPYCPALITYLKEHHRDYRAVLFTTYLYYPSAVGASLGLDNALLLPTAHDEAPIYLRHYEKVFRTPRALLFLTEEERDFIHRKFRNGDLPCDVIGTGIEVPEHTDPESFRKNHWLDNYILYVGRIDESKGCQYLFRYYAKYRVRNPSGPKLALMGKPVMPIPRSDDILSFGFVPDQEKFDGMAGARALVLPSRFESLSMSVLEAMALGTPVLVNGECSVLKAHCLKSNAGLYYKGYYEFEGALDYLLEHPDTARQMGQNGIRYVGENYHWDTVVQKVRQLIDRALA